MEKIQQAIERAREQRAATGAPLATAAVATGATTGGAPSLGEVLSRVRAVRPLPEHLRKHRIIAGVDDDPRSDVFRRLRTQALLRLQALGGRSIAVVSARDGEGKTLVACNLALGIARQTGAPTFLIDMDFRRPTVHAALGFEPEHSLADLIEGRATLEDVAVRLDDGQLFVLPQGRKSVHASELVASSGARGLVQTLLKIGRAHV